MAASFFFYDLETSGLNPRESRIMQFAGQRTDMELNPVGEPFNLLVKLSDDILPDLDSVLITGITPQSTLAEGLTEYEFLQIFTNEIAVPGTIMIGFNTIRFDDEFMRALHYRNFYDPYEWQWQDGRSKWDLLDVVRMTRALRPDGIEWPFDLKGNPTNRLELMTALNKLEHEHAHDALSDVWATINVARLIRNKQQRLFDYLFTMRDKKKVMELVNSGDPFVYTSGKYPGEFQKTTVAYNICDHPKKQGAFVYDLRFDPTQYKDISAERLAEAWKWKKDAEEPRLPVKTLTYNRCPAVAVYNAVSQDPAVQKRIKINMDDIKRNLATLKQMDGFAAKLCKAWDMMDNYPQTSLVSIDKDVDTMIYDGFFEYEDKQKMSVVRAAKPEDLGEKLGLHFKDQRLVELLPLYKARNFPKALTSEERTAWEKHRSKRLLGGGQKSRMALFMARLQETAQKGGLTGHQEYILQELQLYAESIMPELPEADA